MGLPVCTHNHLLRERLYHRGQWNDDPVRRVVDLCAECRAAFRAADVRLELADGSRWREFCLQVEGPAQTIALPVVAAPPVLLPSTGGEVVVSLPVEVEHPVPSPPTAPATAPKTCKVEGCNLEEELAGAVADLEQSDARLRAWELWHQESEGGGNPTLLAGLLRLTRGVRA